MEMGKGTVLSVYITRVGGGPMTSVEEVLAVPRKGLDGDRYFHGDGTYSDNPGSGREVTLIEIEAIEALQRDCGIEIAPGDSRRNIVTRGVPLNHLVAREFTVGAVRFRGTRLCEPCSHLERLTRKGVRNGLIHRGGLRAEIFSQGTIHVGDAVRAGGS